MIQFYWDDELTGRLQISRIMDPLVDKAITGADTDIYDHTSHMQVYLEDPVLMGHSPVNASLHVSSLFFLNVNHR